MESPYNARCNCYNERCTFEPCRSPKEELAYLKSQPLARLATVGPDGQPDVVPIGFEYDGDYFYVGGVDPRKTRKILNVKAGHDQVALVIDDLVSTDPWSPRFLRVYGTAEVVERTGMFGPSVYLRITPTTSWSWHLDGEPLAHEEEAFAPRRASHQVRDQGVG